jgi:hypothetical protein
MNEQKIKQLAEQARIKDHWSIDEARYLTNYLDEQKFALLIVAECVNRVTSKANGWGDMTGFAIKESILDCANDLKQHFGVEE